jgi:hypothetical protein
MAIFADCSTNVADLTAAQFCAGLGGCGNDGVAATSGNLNAILKAIQESTTISGTAYDTVTNILTITYADGSTFAIDFTQVLADAIASGAFVPVGRVINAAGPLLIDGGASANLSADRTLSIDLAALVTALEPSFINPAELDAAINDPDNVDNIGGANGSGWIRHPNDVLEQWGFASGFPVSQGSVSVALPMPYAAGDYNISLATMIPGASDYDNFVQVIDGTVSPTGFTLFSQDPSSGGSSNLTGVYWRTIGFE